MPLKNGFAFFGKCHTEVHNLPETTLNINVIFMSYAVIYTQTSEYFFKIYLQ